MAEIKTFPVLCAHCPESFNIRHALSQPDAESEAEVVVQCPYCSEASMVSIPKKYVEQHHTLRSVKHVPRPEQ